MSDSLGAAGDSGHVAILEKLGVPGVLGVDGCDSGGLLGIAFPGFGDWPGTFTKQFSPLASHPTFGFGGPAFGLSLPHSTEPADAQLFQS